MGKEEALVIAWHGARGVDRDGRETPTIDAVLVAEVLEIRLAPAIDNSVRQAFVHSPGVGVSAVQLVVQLEIGETRVAADLGDQLVTLGTVSRLERLFGQSNAYRGRLRSREAVRVEPILQI